MDKKLQKAIASSRPVDNLRLLMMSHIEGASGTSQLLYESLIASEMEKLKVSFWDFREFWGFLMKFWEFLKILRSFGVF
jgi:hypothetical protein